MMAKTGMLAATTALALAACAGPQVEVRQIASPLSQEDISVADRLGEAHAMMRMGNVGLAIESYRKALRKSPRSALAHVGMARAYDRMGRYDLSLDHYQVALALSPEDPSMYAALSASLRAQGRPVDAARVMAEGRARQIQQTDAVAETRIPAQFLGPPSAPELVAGSLNIVPKPLSAEAVTSGITVRLPQPRRVEGPDAPALDNENIVASGKFDAPVVDLVTLSPEAVPESGLRPDAPQIDAGSVQMAGRNVGVVEIRSLQQGVSISDLPRSKASRPELVSAPLKVAEVKLEAPTVATLERPAEEIAVMPAPKLAMRTSPLPFVDAGPAPVVRDVPLAMAQGVEPTAANPAVLLNAPKVARRHPMPVATKRDRARLERMSSGEVALVTTATPAWESRPAYRSEVVDRTRTKTTVQFTRAKVEAAPVMLIGAGNSMQLAERAKTRLVAEGVRVADTGKSSTARARSVLFYPKGREEDAKALVARFGFRIAAQAGPVEVMTLHLGKDAQAALLGG
ncbi:CHAT domain-containing protein [Sphingomicrobium clamense]|uniref:Tetratricopeptide repeat protein n=1 Tax=Sphingomicrobium clamense TaxID=2851013 RepID=A0ABS6V3E1_9SPHN|nr:tetratricopeptide repeat protein [Sphingomicrobium sp. B8]MBW0144066.1 tetratricopeptide repeat protein [Sphingomicrobium sp. B8]